MFRHYVILLDRIIVVIDLTIIEWCNNKFIIIQSTVMAKNLDKITVFNFLSSAVVCVPACENGACIATNSCLCTEGYIGNTCSEPGQGQYRCSKCKCKPGLWPAARTAGPIYNIRSASYRVCNTVTLHTTEVYNVGICTNASLV